MEKTLKIVSWVEIVLGSLALLNSFSTEDFSAFLGGVLFVGTGVLILNYIKSVKKEKEVARERAILQMAKDQGIPL